MSNTPPNMPGQSPLKNPFGGQPPKPSNNKIKSCPDCGGVVSKKAKKCPHCGAKLPKEVGVFGVIIALFVGLFIYQCTSAMSDLDTASEPFNNLPADSADVDQPQTLSAQEVNPGKWLYGSDTDEMRGTKVTYAILGSSNEIKFEFPYGRQELNIQLRSRPDSDDIMLDMKSGNIICSSFDGCSVAVKFDDGPINQYKFMPSDSYDAETIFLNSGKVAFAEKIRKSKQMMVEIPFYNYGRAQYKFDTSGLKWAEF